MTGEASTEDQASVCLNCDAPLTGLYCASCGQRSLPSKLALGELLGEILGEALELDGRVPRTFVPFLFRPGHLAREYAAGRRARYSSPFRLFLFTTLLWLFASFVARTRTHEDPSSKTIAVTVGDQGTEADGPPDPFSDEEALHELEPEGRDSLELPGVFEDQAQAFAALPDGAKIEKVMSSARESLPSAALFAVPIFAALMKLLFIRRDHYYVEHLVFALHLHAFAFFAIAVGLLIAPSAALIPSFGVISLYALIALRNAYETRWWTSAVRLFILICVHALVLTVTAALLTGIGVLF